jgi:hypothetical protein
MIATTLTCFKKAEVLKLTQTVMTTRSRREFATLADIWYASLLTQIRKVDGLVS